LDDTDCVRQAATDPSISAGTTVPTVYTIEKGHSYIQRQWSRIENAEGVSLVVADAKTDEPLGQLWIAIRPQPGVAGLGYWIVPDARQSGLATRAVRLASDWALGPLAMARLEAWVTPENELSQRVPTATGFQLEGHLRSFLQLDQQRSDALVFSRIPTDD
jgi:RimJ/RimL family protein N-acetyltransferase